MDIPELFITEDGSSSLYVKSINESYHSKYGAISESRHVFIEAGFKKVSGCNPMNILEIGFGTGLNTLLTLIDNNERKVNINFHTLEPFPLSFIIYSKLNYGEVLGSHKAQKLLLLLHKSDWNKEIAIIELFKLKKMSQKLEESILAKNYYNLVYFDAFSPEVQQELWTVAIFEKIYKAMRSNSIFVTYSAKGSVRRNLKEAGFEVERLPGPKGKREMIRAVKL